MHNMFTRHMTDRSGATSIEYSLIAALVALVIVAAATLIGSILTTTFNEIAPALGGES
ncbi:MAG TPA: Flp family type IVb pilin [Aestuariivirgaceae bacterium]|nr:Flp family type IVb pilin [Aestuariivirgaceae bacterium]